MKAVSSFAFWFFNFILSLAVGALVGFLFAGGNVPGIVNAAWISFTVSLAVLLIFPLSFRAARKSCLVRPIRYSVPLILSAAATLVLSLSALSITLNPAFLSVVVLVGLGAASFTFLFVAFVAYLLSLDSER